MMVKGVCHRVLGIYETLSKWHIQGKNDFKSDQKMLFASVTVLTFVIMVQNQWSSKDWPLVNGNKLS